MVQMQCWSHSVLESDVSNHADVRRGRNANGISENDGVTEHFGISNHQIEVFSVEKPLSGLPKAIEM